MLQECSQYSAIYVKKESSYLYFESVDKYIYIYKYVYIYIYIFIYNAVVCNFSN